MIILEDIETKATEREKEKVTRRDTLPPYTPRRVSKHVPPPINSSANLQVPSVGYHRARSSSRGSESSGSASTTTLLYSSSSSNGSTQTLVPSRSPLSSPHVITPNTPPPRPCPFVPNSRFSPHASSSRPRPPSYVRAANSIHVERNRIGITGAFLIDPKLLVPTSLVSNIPDVEARWPVPDPSSSSETFHIATHQSIYQKNSQRNSFEKRAKGKRPNLCLATETGDICTDIWVRPDSFEDQRRNRSQNSKSGQASAECERNFWDDGWTSPPPSSPWPTKTEELVDIDVESEGGSITLRIYAQAHQRLCIRVRSGSGNIDIGVPRTFLGSLYMYSQAHPSRSNSLSSTSTRTAHFNQSSLSLATIQASDMIASMHRRGSSNSGESGASVFLPPMTPSLSSRQQVQISQSLSEVVSPANDGHRLTRKESSKDIGEQQYFDELHIESRSGSIVLFFNDEPPPRRSETLVKKILSKAF